MLVYDQPLSQGQPVTRAPAGVSVLQLARLLTKRLVTIAVAGLVCAVIAVVIGKSLPPKYSATTQLYMDPRELQLVDREVTPRPQDPSGLAMVVESQSRLITSNGVLLQVIQENKLEQDPEFGGGGDSRGAMSLLLQLFGLDSQSAGDAKFGQTTALDALNRHITVKKTDRSFIVDVDVWSRDPAKAAKLANSIANAYLAESKRSQAAAARRATTDLSSHLKELQERLRSAENTLATYKAQNNFVGTQDNQLTDTQLSASSSRLAAAHAQTLDAQSRLDQIEASRRTPADPGAMPETLQSPTIANLRSQFADARKRYAELAGELGPLHPSLRQIEKQVEDLRRNIREEIDRYAMSAKNDLTRARDFEASLNKALDTQKGQSVQLGQASVRLRELERDVEASRDVYQSFLKRSRETEEQETLNTSNARVIGEATAPQQRSFPPGMGLFAIIGFVVGALGAMAWIIAEDQISREPREATPAPVEPSLAPGVIQPPTLRVKRQPTTRLVEKPVVTRLQESDVIRTLSGILALGSTPDVTKLGWPTLRPGFAAAGFLKAMREVRAIASRQVSANDTAVIAVIGAGPDADRSIASINIALAAARDGKRVLMVEAGHAERLLSSRMGARSTDMVNTANGITLAPAIAGIGPDAGDAIAQTVSKARISGNHDLIIIDGPAMPCDTNDRKSLEIADGLVVILPVSLDVNHSLEQIIGILGETENKLIGVVISELDSIARKRRQEKQYA